MTEQEWLTCTDPKPMLRFLLGGNYPRVQDVETFPACKGSDRQMRLFACACYGRICHLLPDALAKDAVEVGERFAEGMATIEELRQAEDSVRRPLESLESRWRASQGAERSALAPTYEALALAGVVLWSAAPKTAYYASSNASHAFAFISNPGPWCHNRFSASQRGEEQVQADILRCIFGRVFHPATIAPDKFASEDGIVIKLARSIYDERAFDRLPALANALEKAGVADQQVLDHCRKPGPHVRGCWAVDTVLGRK